MLEILSKLMGRGGGNNGSKNIAKKRLQLVLVQDRINITADGLESLKNDLIEAIGRHLEIDKNAMEVSFSKEDDQVAIVANIPVINCDRNAI